MPTALGLLRSGLLLASKGAISSHLSSPRGRLHQAKDTSPEYLESEDEQEGA